MNATDTQGISNLTQTAYKLLKEQIIEGKLRQGTLVSISAIARNLNISRTPVTYACLKLEHDKLLTIVPKQGVVINAVSVVEAREIYELRAAVEFYSAWRSFDSITEGTKEKLRDSYQKQVVCIQDNDVAGFMKEDMRFHRILLSILQNNEFLNIFENMSEKAHLLGLESLKSIRRQEENLVEHKAILDKIDGGDKVAFAQAIETNILNGLASLINEGHVS